MWAQRDEARVREAIPRGLIVKVSETGTGSRSQKWAERAEMYLARKIAMPDNLSELSIRRRVDVIPLFTVCKINPYVFDSEASIVPELQHQFKQRIGLQYCFEIDDRNGRLKMRCQKREKLAGTGSID